MNIIFNVLSNLLKYFFNITGDWGIAIVVLTTTVRILLLPISIRQKMSIEKQQAISKKIEGLKVKYRNDKKMLDYEMKKYYKQSAKSMLGCLVTFMQLPVISSLYFVIIRMPVEAGTMIIPWAASIKIPDNYYIIPILYVLVSLSPSLLSYISCLKTATQVKSTKGSLIIMGIFNIIITIKAPVAIGIYFITTGFFSLLEEIGFRIYARRKCLN